MNDMPPTPPRPGLEAVTKAIADLEEAISLSRLQNDPLVHLVRGVQATLISHAAIIAANDQAITEHRMHIDRDFSAVWQARDALVDMTNGIVKSAKAEVEAAHADTARQIVGSIARSAEQKLAAMSRMIWWRTITLGSGSAILILAVGLGLGYWLGDRTGYNEAASSIAASGPVEQAVLKGQGPAGLHQWHQLMLGNGITKTMQVDCHGKNVAHQNGRAACHLWLWLAPLGQTVAHS